MATIEKTSAPWTYVLDEPIRILVVDDDPILREFASVYLSAPSATIETACDGAAARVLLGRNNYDILLLDIEMPRVDGFALLTEIRSNEKLKHLPVIMLTGHDDIASIDRAYQLGANSFANKPVNWRQLSYQVRYVVRTSRTEAPRLDSHMSSRESGAGRPVITEQDVRNFLQSVIHRANALAEQLALHDQGRCRKLLESVHSLAKVALAECFGRKSNSAITYAGRKETVDQRDVAKNDRNLTDRKSADAMALQL